MATPSRTTRKGFRWSAVAAAMLMGVLFAIAGASFGDNLQNDAAATAGITTITAGDSTTITYTLVANRAPSGDVSGCDATALKPVNVQINKPAAVSGASGSMRWPTVSNTARRCADGTAST